ncbi:MAG TPA: hypothetical protein VIZ17_20150 [Acetobacteraceae bacterium]
MQWYLGMQASASTWIYNAALKIAPILAPDRPATGRFVAYHGKLAFLDEPNLLHIVKSHGVDAATADGLARHATSILISVRDPRDAVASLMLYHSQDFKHALTEVERAAYTCAQFMGDSRTSLLRYETRFTETPDTIDLIARAFHRPLPHEARDQIFNDSRRENVEKLINKLEQLPTARRAGDDLYDSETQWHKLHAGRTGEIGKWRHALNDAQIARIEARLFDWMQKFEYAPTRTPGLIAKLKNMARGTT